ncbi:S-layer homology domain-containing protein [Salsuginibacillus kocurii]|uniref:S-layer homology domain-containing protein n=1 Tax=Salsuginibacillus kocurii TaxID=427078 RepID=UPI0003779363|nr:S-layer homology domain-containing protein [Salsuginibacillus kocurii]
MKKVSVSFIVLGTLAMFTVTSGEALEKDWQETYENELNNYISDNEYIHADQSTNIVLADINRNGTPELFKGTSYRTVNNLDLALTYKNGEAIKLNHQGDGLGSSNESLQNMGIGMRAFDHLQLYQNKSTEEFKFIGVDGSSSAINSSIADIGITMEGNMLTTDQISYAFSLNSHQPEEEGSSEYEIYGEQVSEREYEQEREKIFSNKEEVDFPYVKEQFNEIYDQTSDRINSVSLQGLFEEYQRSVDDVHGEETPSSWATDEVEESRQLGLVPENFDLRYQDSMTRLDFSELVVHFLATTKGVSTGEFMEENLSEQSDSPFADTSQQAVIVAFELGIVDGRGDNHFEPQAEITRQEAAVMLERTADHLNLEQARGTINFDDRGEIAVWAEDGVQFVTHATDKGSGENIMNGTSETLFSPNGTYSREQAFITFKRLFQI